MIKYNNKKKDDNNGGERSQIPKITRTVQRSSEKQNRLLEARQSYSVDTEIHREVRTTAEDGGRKLLWWRSTAGGVTGSNEDDDWSISGDRKRKRVTIDDGR